MLGSFRFFSKEKLSLDNEIREIVRDGHRFSNEGFSLVWLDRQTTLRRIAIRIPHEFGGAVARNRAKRILREIFRREKENIRPNTDLVVTIKPARAKLERKEIDHLWMRERFVSLLKEAKIWTGKE